MAVLQLHVSVCRESQPAVWRQCYNYMFLFVEWEPTSCMMAVLQLHVSVCRVRANQLYDGSVTTHVSVCRVRANQLYDGSGKLLENSHDLCDCLDVKCPGCHFPCPKCTSEKCGLECRGSRRWTYDYVEVEGTNCVIPWPFKTEWEPVVWILVSGAMDRIRTSCVDTSIRGRSRQSENQLCGC